jgi:hypothetical protein
VTKNPDPVHMAYSPLRRFLPLLLSVLCLVWLVNGCSSRPAAAQRLFAQGDYQRVIEKYPDLEIARRAEAKLAEKLLEDKRYGDVIRQYPQTPAAYKAKQSLAQQLFDAGNYVAVIDSFSYLPLAAQARERIADSLFASGRFDDLIMRYPDTPQAKELKERRAQKALAEAKKKHGEARRQALEEIMRLYSGTSAYKEAADLHAKTRPPTSK